MRIFERFVKNECGNIAIIMSLIAVAIGLLVLAVVLTIGPVVGYNVENSVTVPATSGWNSVGNAGILNGSEVWTQDTPLIGSAAIVVIAAIIISVLLGAFMIRQKG